MRAAAEAIRHRTRVRPQVRGRIDRRDLGNLDIARRARRYLDQHDHAGATWAARRGLLASPYDERLYRQLMRAAYQTGNPPGVDAIMRELLHVLDAEGEPVDELHPRDR
jgi:hypothetical protein